MPRKRREIAELATWKGKSLGDKKCQHAPRKLRSNQSSEVGIPKRATSPQCSSATQGTKKIERRIGGGYHGVPTPIVACIDINKANIPSSAALKVIMMMSQKLSCASGQWNFRRRSVTRTISVVMIEPVERCLTKEVIGSIAGRLGLPQRCQYVVTKRSLWTTSAQNLAKEAGLAVLDRGVGFDTRRKPKRVGRCRCLICMFVESNRDTFAPAPRIWPLPTPLFGLLVGGRQSVFREVLLGFDANARKRWTYDWRLNQASAFAWCG